VFSASIAALGSGSVSTLLFFLYTKYVRQDLENNIVMPLALITFVHVHRKKL
jgi:hypothetical protein